MVNVRERNLLKRWIGEKDRLCRPDWVGVMELRERRDISCELNIFFFWGGGGGVLK